MNVHALVSAALEAVLPNTWAVELPPVPTWPAVVFDIDSKPEELWCACGGYDQHSVNIVAMAEDLDVLIGLMPQLLAAMEALHPQYQFDEDAGDADYEDDPDVFAQFLTVRLRTPRY